MGIKEWFFSDNSFKDPEYLGKYEEKKESEKVKKESEITFESDEEISRKNRSVKVNNEVIGEFIFNNNRWEWKQAFRDIMKYASYESMSMNAMIAITEKLKELNVCSDTKVVMQRQKGCVLCELEGRGLCAICKIGMPKK